jgi:signal transduction histidine kinase/CheY-like chemotaxis protein
LQAGALTGVWATLGLVWLSLHTLNTAVEWAKYSYERTEPLLEQARDSRQELAETLQDLTSANAQLTRLNEQANALRLYAEEQRQAKERFAANVSHELRTPLNMIIGFCEMMTQVPESYGDAIPPSLLADLEVVLRNSRHLSSLIDDVLDLSKIDAGQMALTRERVDLAEIIDAAVLAVRPLYESKGLYLQKEAAPDLPQVFCDRVRIRQVLLNLLSNAGRFTESGGVVLHARRDGADVVLSVADTGPGIAEEEKERLFQPFAMLDGTTGRRYGGTGLGLSISKSFVEMHEGRMWLESEPGHGATFFFCLPIDPPTLVDGGFLRWFSPYQTFQPRTWPSRLHPPVLRRRLVVVERGDCMKRLLGRYLDDVDIVPADSLDEGLREVSRTPAQALLVNDLRPGEALVGISAAAALPYGTPALVCSIPSAEDAACGERVSGYLLKPVTREALLAALDRLRGPLRTVLVIDDDPDVLQLFGRILAQAERGYRVLRASNGRQGLEILRSEPVDVVLLDLIMPEMDGFAFLAARSQDATLSSIPTILVSAHDPGGQPIVSNALAVVVRDGLSMRDLLASIEVLCAILSKASPHGDSVPQETHPG